MEPKSDDDPIEIQVRKCSLVVKLTPTVDGELADMPKDTLLANMYSKGARVRWISGSEAMVVFPNERSAILCLSQQSFSMKIQRLVEMGSNEMLDKVATDLYASMKQTKDSTVASRMISSALGIKIKPTISKKLERTPSPPRVDAWDD